MTPLAVRVTDLGKRYRIGMATKRGASPREQVRNAVLLPFGYLFSSLREPSEDETLWALRDVTFDVHEGEVLGIVGRNGAGKSTLLKILSQITEPTTGQAELYGRVGSLLEVGTGFHQELTGRENVYLNGAILGMSKAEIDAKFDEIVDFAGVGRFTDTPVKRYSSGMKVRLAFAVAAHLEPELLVVDEVLAVGDAEFQAKCLGKMENIAQEGRTVLFVSHNMPAVTRLCTRAILLRDGAMVMDGDPDEVVATYLDTTGGGSGQRRWSVAQAPGTEELRLVGVTLLSTENEVLTAVDVGQPLSLRLSYRVERPGLKFRCVAKLYTQGTCAFVTLEPREVLHQQAGLYHSTVSIPPHLLAEGEYRVGISMLSSRGRRVDHVSEHDVLSFHVSDRMTGSSARGDYTESLVGVVRPRLPWTTTCSEEATRSPTSDQSK